MVPRNQTWNTFIAEMRESDEDLSTVVDFLKRHKQEMTLPELDASAVLSLDRVIKSYEQQIKTLRRLRTEIVENR